MHDDIADADAAARSSSLTRCSARGISITAANLAARRNAKPELDRPPAGLRRRGHRPGAARGRGLEVLQIPDARGPRSAQGFGSRTCASGSASTIRSTIGACRSPTCWPSKASWPKRSRCWKRFRPTASLAPANSARSPIGTWSSTSGEKHEDALLAIFATAQEWELQNWLWQQLRPWQIPRRPGAQRARQERAPRIRHAVQEIQARRRTTRHQLREFYRATRDFRLLAGLADAMIGHTAERVYPFLQSLDQVFAEVREEATVDSMVDEIEKVRAAAPRRTLDQRALDLLEVIVERRASDAAESTRSALGRAPSPRCGGRSNANGSPANSG